jgi:hypothetical protein
MGAYNAYLRVVSNTPYNDTIVPVSMDVQQVQSFTSQAANDGWVLETSEDSNMGGLFSPSALSFILGDDARNRQYRSLLSFKTASLPDNAVITKAILKIKLKGSTGSVDVTAFRGFLVDMVLGCFGAYDHSGANAFLGAVDFQTPADKTVGPFNPAPSDSWYSLDLTNGSGFINKLTTRGGLSQLRLRFKLDDNNNRIADTMSFFSGNASLAERPTLIIQYYVP